MADNPGRLLLVKAKVDLTAFKDSLKQMQNMVKSVNLALAPKTTATVSTSLKETLDAERQKQIAKQATLKVGDSSVVQEKSLRAELMRTMELRQQETAELQKQVTALREKVAAENALLKSQHEGVRQQTQRTIQQERAIRQPTAYQGVIPTMVRTAPAVAQTVAATGASAEAAAYQNQLMRQMRMSSSGKAPAGAPVASPLTASLAGGLMGGLTNMPSSDAARLQEQRARELRMQTAPILQAPVMAGGWVEKDPATGRFRAKQQTPTAPPPPSPEEVRAQRSQQSAFTRMTVTDAAAQVRLTQVTEGQKKALVLGSLDVQRDALRAQLRSQQISFVQYISQMKVLVAQEKATKLAAIAAEEKALLALLQTKLKVNAITPQAFQTQSSILNAQMGMQRTAVENASNRQLLMFNRQQPQPRGGKGEEGSMLRGMGMGITRSLGGGLVGSIATGMLFGGGTLMVFDQAARGIEHMMHSMKEFILASGPMQQVNAQFQTLAKGAGIDAPAFMDKLRASTHGLVGNMDLMRVATGALRSNLKLSDTDILRLVKDTTELARVQGKSVPQAMKVLDTAMQTGQFRGVARYIGLNQRELMMNVAPRGATIQQREQIQMRQFRAAEESRLAKTGIAPETMTESFEKLKQAQSTFWEEFGQGMATSAGTKSFVGTLAKMAEGIGGLTEAARKMGAALGDVFGVIGKIAEDVAKMFSHLHESLGSNEKDAWLTSVYENLTSIKGILWDIYVTWRGLVLGAKDLAATWEYLKGQSGASSTVESAKAGAKAFAANYSPTGLIVKPVVEGAKAAWKAGKPQPQTKQDLGNIYEANRLEDQNALDRTQEMLSGGRLAAMKKRAAALRQSIASEFSMLPAHAGVAGPLRIPEPTALAVKKLQLAEMEKQIAQQEKSSAGGKAGDTTGLDPAVRAQKMRDAQAELKQTELTEKRKRDIIMASLDYQRDMQRRTLKDGETDLGSYVEKMKGFIVEEKVARLAEIGAVEKAQKVAAQKELGVGGISQQDYAEKIKTNTAAAADQRVEAERQANKQIYALGDQLNEDRVAAEHKMVTLQFQMRKDAVDRQQQIMKDSYEKQLIDVNTYLQSEHDAVKANYDNEIAMANQRFQDSDGLEAATAQLGIDYQKAKNDREKQTTTLIQGEAQERIKAAQLEYQTISGFIQARQQLQVAQRGGQALPAAQQRDDLNAQIAALSKAITTMQAAIETAPAEQRMMLAPQLMAKQQELIPLQVQQAQLNEGPIPLSSLGDLASALGQLPQGKTRAFGGVGAIPQFMKWMTEQQQAQGEGKVPGIISGPMQNLGLLFRDLFTNTRQLPDAFRNLEQSLLPAIQAIASFASAVQQGPVAGAIAGAGMGKMLFSGGGMFSGFGSLLGGLKGKSFAPQLTGNFQPTDTAPTGAGGVQGTPPTDSGGASGAVASASSGVGGAVSGIVNKMSGAMSSLGGMAGPLGSIAGAAFGAILSSIVQKKQEQAEHYLMQMQLQFQSVTLALQTGQIGMNQAISEAISLRNDVQAQMNNSSKKKRSAYQQEIQGMSQQIQQLQAQQVQQIQQLYEQVNTVGASPLNAFTQQLQQIITQYTQFAGAATTTEQLATATEWLTKSLQGYAQTQMTAMNQAETGAIQDAIQLNDLYVQRNELLQQEANTEYNIMTQGILTRQQTTAQSKMEQIALMKQQDSLQLQNLNEQISAAQFRVDAEKQIFNLATTRVGLEMQLLAMQNQSTTLQMAQVAALQQVVMAMQSGNFQSIVTGGLNLNTNAPGYQAFWNLLQALGTQPSNLMNSFLQQFNNMSGYGFGGFSIVSGGG